MCVCFTFSLGNCSKGEPDQRQEKRWEKGKVLMVTYTSLSKRLWTKTKKQTLKQTYEFLSGSTCGTLLSSEHESNHALI